MSLRRALRRLFNNWPIKLAALLTALLLWYQLREVEPVTERVIERPLEVVGLGPDRKAVGLPSNVVVRLRGTSRVVGRLSPRAVVAFIDLSEVKSGNFTVPVSVRVPSGISLVDVTPAEISSRIERIAAAVVPVEVFSPGAAVLFSPSSAEVRGAESLVDKARSAVGVDVRASGKARLLPLDERGKPIEGLEINPQEAHITFQGPELTRKEVDLLLMPAPRSFRPVEVKAPDKVVIVGPAAKLRKILSLRAEADWRVGEYDAVLRLRLPEGVDTVGAVVAHLKVEPAKPLQ